MNPWDDNLKPDFVNEAGVKWWVDPSLTRYAREPNVRDTKLDDVICFYTEEPNGVKSRVLVRNQQVIFESQSLETIAVEIDKMKFLKEMS